MLQTRPNSPVISGTIFFVQLKTNHLWFPGKLFSIFEEYRLNEATVVNQMKTIKTKKKEVQDSDLSGVRATNSYFSLPIFSQPIFKLNDCIGPAIYLVSCHYLWETISIWPLKEYFNWLISGLSTGYAVNGFKKFFYAWALIKVYLIKMWHD